MAIDYRNTKGTIIVAGLFPPEYAIIKHGSRDADPSLDGHDFEVLEENERQFWEEEQSCYQKTSQSLN